MLEWELANLLEGTSDAAFTVDLEGEIRTWNKAAERLFGYQAATAVGKSCSSLIGGQTENIQVCCEGCTVLECVRSGKNVANYDMRVRSASGRPFWVNVSILVVSNARTDRRLTVHFMRDIEMRKTSEKLTRRVLAIAKTIVNSSDDTSNLPPVAALTQQEVRILNLIASGRSTKHLADELQISARTLRNHVHHINQKLHTRNRLEAVCEARRRNIV